MFAVSAALGRDFLESVTATCGGLLSARSQCLVPIFRVLPGQSAISFRLPYPIDPSSSSLPIGISHTKQHVSVPTPRFDNLLTHSCVHRAQWLPSWTLCAQTASTHPGHPLRAHYEGLRPKVHLCLLKTKMTSFINLVSGGWQHLALLWKILHLLRAHAR